MENAVNTIPEVVEEKKNKYTKLHAVFALLALVLGCMYRNWFFWNDNVPFASVLGEQAGFFMFTVVFAVYIIAFVFTTKKKLSFHILITIL